MQPIADLDDDYLDEDECPKCVFDLHTCHCGLTVNHDGNNCPFCWRENCSDPRCPTALRYRLMASS